MNDKKRFMLLMAASLALSGCTQTSSSLGKESAQQKSRQESAASSAQTDRLLQALHASYVRPVIFSLVSSAENSTVDYPKEYGYIEDIQDGRGYTAGLIGFTSATGDLLEVVEAYVALEPQDNKLASFLPALKKAVDSDTHAGLGKPFVKAWKEAADQPAMHKAQNEIINKDYWNPAMDAALEDGLSVLGLYIYYDCLVVHGPGDDEDSFGGIRAQAMKNALPPARGGEQSVYLKSFLDAREAVMSKEEAHQDLSRIDVQRQFIKEKKWDLSLPLAWTMYGDHFSLSKAINE